MRVADARVISYFPIADADPIAPVAVHRALTSYLSAPRSHTSPAYDHDELFGVDGCDVREMVIRYDFASMHRCMHGTSPGTPNQLLGHEGDIFLTGAPGAVLAMRWGDLAGARLSWQKAAEGWARLHSAVDAGRLDWVLYMCSMRFSRASRSVALAMNDMEAVDGLLRHTLEGIAARSPGDGYAVTRFLTLVERKGVAGPGLGSWEHGGGCAHGEIWREKQEHALSLGVCAEAGLPLQRALAGEQMPRAIVDEHPGPGRRERPGLEEQLAQMLFQPSQLHRI